MFKCPQCNTLKEHSEFYKDISRTSGRSSKCKLCSKKYFKSYFKKNKSQILIYQKTKYKRNLNFKLTKVLRSRLRDALNGNFKTGSAVEDLGCSIEFLKQHLESKFSLGMTWDNWAFDGWHIDHIIPLCEFDLTKEEQLKKAVHYTNLQPLWAKDNFNKKSNKFNDL